MKYLLIILLLSGCTVNKYYCLDCKQKKSYAEQVDPHFHISPKTLRWWRSHPMPKLDLPIMPSLLIPEKKITYFASDSVNTEIISVDSLMIDKSKYILTPSESQGETAIGVIDFLKNKKSDSKQKVKVKK